MSERDGAVRQVFATRLVVHLKALIGALHLLYRLAKEEIAHTTNSPWEVATLLGCDYLHEVNLGRNTWYSSEQIIAEMLQCLTQVIVKQILSDLQPSNFFTDDR